MTKLGFAVCGSFCNHAHAVKVLEALVKAYDVTPILSPSVCATDTRFGRADDFFCRVSSLCGRRPMTEIAESETLAGHPMELLLVCPCTGNTMAKAAHGITDTAVTMAIKAHLRQDRPLVLALASNDALSANAVNLGVMLARKNVYLTPMKQDDPAAKPHSLVADFSRVEEALSAAAEGRQLTPIFL